MEELQPFVLHLFEFSFLAESQQHDWCLSCLYIVKDLRTTETVQIGDSANVHHSSCN
jgi:hypothetical protein